MIIFQIILLIKYRQIIVAPLFLGLIVASMKLLLLYQSIAVQTVIPLFILFFCIFENKINSLFDITNNEFMKYQLFPIHFQSLVIAKNLAAAFVTIFCLLLFSFIVFFMFQLTTYKVFLAFTYGLTIVFPFIMLRNITSSRPTKNNSLKYAFINIVISIFAIILFSIPYFVIKIIFNTVVYCYPYILIMLFLWRYISIPVSAKQLSKNIYKIIELT